MKKLALVLCFLSLAGALTARAETVVYNNITATSYTDSAWVVGGPDDGQFFSVDNSFTLTSTATINEIVAGVWVPTGTTLQDVSGGIYSQPFGQGTAFVSGSDLPLSSTLESTSFENQGWDVYQETLGISNVTLAPGTYYLAFLTATTVNGDNVNGFEAAWDWSANPNTSADQWIAGNTSGISGSTSTTFELLGPGNSPVPEPSSLLLLGSGAAALFGAMRRRVKA